MKKIGDVIALKRKEKGISQSELASRLLTYDIRVKNAAISSWEKNVNIPNAYQLLAICEILDIVDIYSAFIQDKKDNIVSELNETGIQRVQEYIKLLKQSNEFVASPNKTKNISLHRVLPVALLPASAGLGEIVGDEMFEDYEVDDTVPLDVDFGVRLSGDSMEPTLDNGDIAWVKKTNIVNYGEIGLFLLNGMTYCKRLRKTGNRVFLSSDNQKYKPIEIKPNDNLRTYGVVLNRKGGKR